ncbi:hypothetical protein HDV02_001138 [Globomyces sp. JEL0801]|nr:hypothetical protein HDV02_001138 [Globomyces sp. JEL0801]
MSETTPLINTSEVPTKKRSTLFWWATTLAIIVITVSLALYGAQSNTGFDYDQNITLDSFPEADADLNNLKMYALHVDPTTVDLVKFTCTGLVACNVTTSFKDVPKIDVQYLVQSSETDVFEYLQVNETLVGHEMGVSIASPADYEFYRERYNLSNRKGFTFKLQVLVHLILPLTTAPSFDMKSDLGLLNWNGINLNMDKFDVFLDIGEIKVDKIQSKTFTVSSHVSEIQVFKTTVDEDLKIHSDLGNIFVKDTIAKNVDLMTNVGSIEGQDVVAQETVQLKTDVGRIRFVGGVDVEAEGGSVTVKSNAGSASGSFSGYKSFTSTLDTGSMEFELKPKTDYDTQSVLESKIGSIDVDFNGEYDLSSDMGRVSVKTGRQSTLKRKPVKVPSKTPPVKTPPVKTPAHKTGRVGQGKSTLKAVSMLGSISAKFE